MASVMYCLARSAAVSRASASRRFRRFAASCRASPSICLSSSSLASSAVRLATRSSSCCCCATSRSYFAAAASACFSRSATAFSRAWRSLASASMVACRLRDRGLAADQRLLERLRLLAFLSRLAFGLGQRFVGLLFGLEQRLLLAGFGVALGVLEEARACSSARPTVSAAMRLRLATQTANTAAAVTRVTRTLIGTRISATRGTSFPVLPRGFTSPPAIAQRTARKGSERRPRFAVWGGR